MHVITRNKNNYVAHYFLRIVITCTDTQYREMVFLGSAAEGLRSESYDHLGDAFIRRDNMALYVGLARSRAILVAIMPRRGAAIFWPARRGAAACPTPVYAYRGARVPTNVGRELNTVTPNIKRLRHRVCCTRVPRLCHTRMM